MAAFLDDGGFRVYQFATFCMVYGALSTRMYRALIENVRTNINQYFERRDATSNGAVDYVHADFRRNDVARLCNIKKRHHLLEVKSGTSGYRATPRKRRIAEMASANGTMLEYVSVPKDSVKNDPEEQTRSPSSLKKPVNRHAKCRSPLAAITRSVLTSDIKSLNNLTAKQLRKENWRRS